MNSHRSSPTRKKIIVLALGILLLIVAVVVYAIKSYVPVAVQLVVNKGVTLKEAKGGRINILALGIGGASHEGPNLTDTIIFASIDPDKKEVTFVSIPRDLWVPTLDSKINKAYSDGEDEKKGGGLILAKAAVSKNCWTTN